MPSIAVGQTGTLVFQPTTAGLDPALVASVSWQPQGSQQDVRFTPPDRVEGIAVGRGDYRATVTLSTPGEKVSYAFTVDCYVPGPPAMPAMVPVTIAVAPPATPSGPPPVTR